MRTASSPRGNAWKALWLVAALSLIPMSCGGEQPGNHPTPTVEAVPWAVQEVTPLSSRTVTLNEAQSLLPFKVIMPTFFPEGTSQATPTVRVDFDSDGTADRAQATYLEDNQAVPSVRRMRMRITEAEGEHSVGGSPGREVTNVRGVAVELGVGLFGPEDTQIVAMWNQGGTVFEVEFYWLPAEGTNQGEVTEQMRADALKVIESMIQ
jgi:hypothetical protein